MTSTASTQKVSSLNLHRQSVSVSGSSHAQSSSVSITSSRVHRKKGGGGARSQQNYREADKPENVVKVLDPETREDRTPLPLAETSSSKSAIIRKKLAGAGEKATASASEGITSSAMGSVSSELEDRSFRVNESTESGSETPKSASVSISEDGDNATMEPMTNMDTDSAMDTSSMDSRLALGEEKKKKELKDKSEDLDENEEDLGLGLSRRKSTPGDTGESVGARKPRRKKDGSLDDENAPCTIHLVETPTFFLLERADEQIAIDSEEAPIIIERNHAYQKLMKEREITKYSDRSVQTFENPQKSKEAQFNRPEVARANVGVSTWEIFDTMRRLEEEEADTDAFEVQRNVQNDDESPELVDDASTAMLDGMTLDEDANEDGGGEGARGSSRSKHAVWMQSPALPLALMIVERMVVQNIWQIEQLVYRNIVGVTPFTNRPAVTPVSPTSPEDDAFKRIKSMSPNTPGMLDAVKDASKPTSSPGNSNFGDETDKHSASGIGFHNKDFGGNKREEEPMRVLWRYSCPVTKDKNVSCLAWNHINSDILAVGYGDYGLTPSSAVQQGYVCCWSIKNPVYPERIFRVESAGVSSVDFSYNHPSLLAVGYTDGTLCLFDIRKQGSAPVVTSSVSGGQHTGTVWQVKWAEKGKDRGESLISISADGLVTDWSINKGLECTNLMRLKRMPNKQQGHSQMKGEALLSRQSGGMCIDFNPSERFNYVVGTEDGTIHKCSISYNEQYLETYAGHAGPVYRCKWSPFCSDIFLTCSADWTIKLWRQDKIDSLLIFQSTPNAVHDVSWSPNVSTMFAAVTSTGRIDLWDLVKPLEPKTSLEFEGRSLNCVAFAEQGSSVLVVGDNVGDVAVVKLTDPEFDLPAGTEGEQHAQEERLLKFLKKNTQ